MDWITMVMAETYLPFFNFRNKEPPIILPNFYSFFSYIMRGKKLNIPVLIGFSCLIFQGFGQNYITGTTFFDSTQRAPYTKIMLSSTKLLYQSGSSGDFGIPSPLKKDTLIAWAEGYDTLRQLVSTGITNTIMLKPNAYTQKQALEKGKLSNLIANYEEIIEPSIRNTGGETYPTLLENKWVKAYKHPQVGISPSNNKASYANTRRFIKNSSPVNQHAVRVEELVNYLMLPCAPQPAGGNTFSLQTTLTNCPWNPNAALLSINSVAKALDFSKMPPANLVFLIDNSGSMEMPNRLPILKSAFCMLVKTLREIDRVSIVTYGGGAGIHLPPTSGQFKDSILASIDRIQAGGGTPGSSGIHLAYQLALANPIPGANNRVILATDGDFNLGLISEKDLEDLIRKHSQSGVKLTCLGVGMGNLKESKIETLARHGNGNYAYLDSENEAEKVMVQEFSPNLYSVATDVTFEIKWNPDIVEAFKIVGYENRVGSVTSKYARLVGGEVGSGFPLNLFVEINRVDAVKNSLQDTGLLGTVQLLFKPTLPLNRQETKLEEKIPLQFTNIENLNPNIRLAIGAAFFGNYLKTRELQTPETYELLHKLVYTSIKQDLPTHAEFLKLIEQSKPIYVPEVKETKKPVKSILKRKQS